MHDEQRIWFSNMATEYPALSATRQRRLLFALIRLSARLQAWESGLSTSAYLRRAREAVSALMDSQQPLWRTDRDTHACWLAFTEQDAQKCAALARRWKVLKSLRELLLLHNQRMVIRIALRKMPQGMDHSDLVMEGNVGLMRAIDLFDPRKNFRFSTYAHFWIEQSISLALKQKGFTVRTPLSALQKAWDERTESGTSDRQSRVLLSRDTVSLDDPDATVQLGDDNGTESFERIDSRRMVQQILDGLPDRLRRVLTLRYGIDQRDAVGYREIADQLGVSRERARQLEREALDRLRTSA